MVAQHPVGHGHFGRQGLQRVEPLVGVFHVALQLPVLLFQGYLIVHEGVVVPNLPQHSRIRAYRERHGNSTNDGQHRQSVEHVSRNDQLTHLTRRRRDEKCIALTCHASKAPHAYLSFSFSIC